MHARVTRTFSSCGHACSGNTDVLIVGTCMLRLTRTLSSCGHACSGKKTTAGPTFSTAKSRKHRKERCIRCQHARSATTLRKTRQARHFEWKWPRNTENTDVVGMCAARVNSTVVPKTREQWATLGATRRGPLTILTMVKGLIT